MTGVVIGSGLVVSAGVDGLNTNSPIIGYQNLVTASNITATTEDTSYPATNLANPATHLIWRSGAGSPSSDEHLTVTLDTPEDVDYLAIARHNLGSSQATVSVEASPEDPASPQSWDEIISERLLPDDGPVIFRFTKRSYTAVRLRIQDSLAAVPVTPFVAVMYVGALLVMQRRIYVGHTPMKYGRSISVANHRSISGNFLGRIVLSESRSSHAEFKNLTPDWYRTYLDPFILSAQENPFFFAWRPGTYPNECGYAWLTSDPRPSNQLANGMMQVGFDMGGIA
jgi:hypothetical protein